MSNIKQFPRSKEENTFQRNLEAVKPRSTEQYILRQTQFINRLEINTEPRRKKAELRLV